MPSIRPMTAADLPAAQNLLAQLGYPIEPAELRRRHAAVAAAPGHALLVAEQSGQLLALCHLYARPALDKPPEAILQALIVDQAARHTGLGTAMLSAAETWATAQGYTSLALASNITRANAHRFYTARGYQQTATSHLFRKVLGP